MKTAENQERKTLPNGTAGYCTTIEDTQGVHLRKLKLIK